MCVCAYTHVCVYVYACTHQSSLDWSASSLSQSPRSSPTLLFRSNCPCMHTNTTLSTSSSGTQSRTLSSPTFAKTSICFVYRACLGSQRPTPLRPRIFLSSRPSLIRTVGSGSDSSTSCCPVSYVSQNLPSRPSDPMRSLGQLWQLCDCLSLSDLRERFATLRLLELLVPLPHVASRRGSAAGNHERHPRGRHWAAHALV